MAVDREVSVPGTTLEAALAYAARGWAVLPVRPGAKVPLTSHGVKGASRDEKTIRDWWNRWPHAGVAIACGMVSGGLVVLDVDKAEMLWQLEKTFGPLPKTRTVRTGRGTHHYFLSPTPIRTQQIVPGLEVRGEGVYVLAPPSVHPNGRKYEVIENLEPVSLPKTLCELLSKPAGQSPSAAPAEKANIERIREGARNSTLTSLSGSMRRRGMTYEGILAALLEENMRRCDPPLPDAEVQKIAVSVARYDPSGESYSRTAREEQAASLRGASAATVLVKLAMEQAKFFHYGESCFATVPVEGHQETFAIRSRGFRAWLTKIFFQAEKRAAGAEPIASAILTLEGFARFESEERATFIRVAAHAGCIFFDLCNPTWQVVQITSGSWRLIEAKDCPVRFRRAHGMLPLPTPGNDGKIDSLGGFLNFGSDDDFRLIVGWLLAAVHPSGPYPILVLHGEQGSGKSTAARILRALVDPNLAPIRTEPKEPRDLAIAAGNSWLCAFDNVSHLPDWLSDALCRLSTGGGFSTRMLYSDDEEQIFEARRPILLNSIEEVTTRPDLLDRSLIVYLPRVSEERRLEEAVLSSGFEKARPGILGAILDAVSCALRSSAVVLEARPRMLDAAVWVTRGESSFGWQPGTFAQLYCSNASSVNELPLETPLGEALRKVELPWTGTATELLLKVESLSSDKAHRSKSWPGSGRALSNTVRRLAPNLRQIGIEVEFSREGKARRRLITLFEKMGKSTSASSVAARADSADGADDRIPQPSNGIVPIEEKL